MAYIAVIYIACVVGAVAILLILPRRGSKLATLGGVLGAGALGAAMLALTRAVDPTSVSTGDESGPGVLFYLLGFLAIGGAVRMISHPKPVYAALYFIMVVLSSAGLLLLLSAEFMAFALIIVYAGAILITYLFVIMMAVQTPDATNPQDTPADYDANAHEPLAATAAGFVLLALLLSLMLRGGTDGQAGQIASRATHGGVPELAQMTMKVQKALRSAGAIGDDAVVTAVYPELDLAEVMDNTQEASSLVPLPATLVVDNVERVGVSLMTEFPVSLEVAGVILMMAMLGAVVLARKPFEAPPATVSAAGAKVQAEQADQA